MVGGRGIDVHIVEPYTEELWRGNIFDAILNLLGRSGYGSRNISDHNCMAAD